MSSNKNKKNQNAVEGQVSSPVAETTTTEVLSNENSGEIHFDVSETIVNSIAENDGKTVETITDTIIVSDNNGEIVSESTTETIVVMENASEIVSENAGENSNIAPILSITENADENSNIAPVVETKTEEFKLVVPRAVKNLGVVLVAFKSTYQHYNAFGKYIANGAKLNLSIGKFKENKDGIVLDEAGEKIPAGHNFDEREEKNDIAAHVKYLDMPWHPEYTPKNHDCFIIVAETNLAQLRQNISDFLAENPSDFWKGIVSKCFAPVAINEDGTPATIIYQLPVVADVISDVLHDAAVDATKEPVVMEEEMA